MHWILLKTYILLPALLQWLALYTKLAGGKGNIYLFSEISQKLAEMVANQFKFAEILS